MRLSGLDTLRAAAAVAVVLGHLPFVAADSWPPLYSAARGLFAGPPAVIVFFVISGLCIHWPQREGAQLDVAAFYTRRLLRIGLPAGAAIGLWFAAGLHPFPLNKTVFWSIVCECVYYALYPALKAASDRIGWISLIAIAYVAALVLCLLNLPVLEAQQNAYTALGSMTWAVGLPCWLLGCWLAENVGRVEAPGASAVWSARAGIFAVAGLLQALKFHGHSVAFSYCFTLNAFAVLACYWVGLELAYFSQRSPSRWGEWAGAWSYSLYLTHPVVVDQVQTSGTPAHLAALALAPCLAFAFYLAVERPAHRLAIVASKLVSASRSAARTCAP